MMLAADCPQVVPGPGRPLYCRRPCFRSAVVGEAPRRCWWLVRPAGGLQSAFDSLVRFPEQALG